MPSSLFVFSAHYLLVIMKKIVALVFLCCFIGNLSAQLVSMDEMYLDEGKMFFDKGRYEQAIPKLLKAYDASNTDEEAIYYLALSYKYIDDNEMAIEYFNELIALNPEYSAWFYYQLGEAYLEQGDFMNAAIAYNSFVIRYADNDIHLRRGKCRLRYARESPVVRKSAESELPPPISLGIAVNSNQDDYMPSTIPNGRRIYFTSTRFGGLLAEIGDDAEGDEDLYYTDKENGMWQTPQLLPPPLNSISNEGAPAISADGQTMVFTACGRKDSQGSCDLYISYLRGNTWSQPVNMGSTVNSAAWDSQPSISSDGKRIYFSSSRSGGYGEEDIYVTIKIDDNRWGTPQNLGPIINTPFEDKSPFISADRKTLYFASKGHPGFGDFDVFTSRFENNVWGEPVNMGTPVNTDKSDLYFTIGGPGEVAYMASERRNDVMNLFEVTIPKKVQPTPTVIVSGVVTNQKSGEAISAVVLVEDLSNGELIAKSQSNSATGSYLVVLPEGKHYSVSIAKENYFFYSNNFNIPVGTPYKEMTKNIALSPIEKGLKIVLNNIFFETAKADLKPESAVELDRAVKLLRENTNIRIEVSGHTDNVGAASANLTLSHNRANAVVNYLIAHGIDASRLSAKGYGETQPIATNETKEGRQLNRRVEFLVVEM